MKVMIATDGSAHADAALDVVMERPWSPDTQFYIVSVVQPANEKLNKLFDTFGLGTKAAEAHARYKEETAALVEKCKQKLVAKFGADRVIADVVEGDERHSIVQQAASWEADTLVIGSHGKRNAAEAVLGGVTERVLSHCDCTVEILKNPSLRTLMTEIERKQPIEEDKYLIALDDSEVSNILMEAIMQREWRKGSYFRIISVVEPLVYGQHALGPWQYGEATAEMVGKVEKLKEQAALELVEGAAARLQERFPDANVTAEVVLGEPKDKIIEASKNWPADLILLGSHGHRGLAEFVIGSVSRSVANAAPCSVAIFKNRRAVRFNEGAKSASASGKR